MDLHQCGQWVKVAQAELGHALADVQVAEAALLDARKRESQARLEDQEARAALLQAAVNGDSGDWVLKHENARKIVARNSKR